MASEILYKKSDVIGVGGIHRFVVTYTPEDINTDLGKSLHFRIKNNENILLAPAFLNGPYVLYADIRDGAWKYQDQCFSTNEQPVFEPNINPGQSLNHKITLNKLQDKYVWIVEVVSQIVFSTTAQIGFEFAIAWTHDALGSGLSSLKDGNYSNQRLSVQHLNTLDIWQQPPKSVLDPIHLVILTHGLHSNVTADMSYLKEQIELQAASTGENIVIRGYPGNVCKTERGVEYLGRRLGEYVVNEAMKDLPENLVKKISFVGHSLGGLVQTFAISYIDYNYPNFFKRIQPENFVAMASPMLGISNENPAYVKLCLKIGIVGKSGQDLNLQGSKPLLLLLPSEPTRKILNRFKRRSVYANVINDGIVPLRTSALLYLDWKGLSNVYQALKKGEATNLSISNSPEPTSGKKHQEQTSEIPNQMNMKNDGGDEENDNEDDSTDGFFPSFLTSIKGKVQSTISFCLPSLGYQQKNMSPKYKYFQAELSAPSADDNESNMDNLESENRDQKETHSLIAIPKSNVLTSLSKVVLPPLPALEYINDPSSRKPTIIHDKIYTPSMIPEIHTKMPSSKVLAQLDIAKRQKYLEQKIARRWHMGMSWRKIIVVLKPDAHNNMVVRRRFANAYGWSVVDHMVKENFSEKCFKGEDLQDWVIGEGERDKGSSYDSQIDLDVNENEELANKFDGVLDKQWKKEHPHGADNRETETLSDQDDTWLGENDTGYYDGPTGMINNVNVSVTEGVDAVRRGFLASIESDQGNNPTQLDQFGELNAYI